MCAVSGVRSESPAEVRSEWGQAWRTAPLPPPPRRAGSEIRAVVRVHPPRELWRLAAAAEVSSGTPTHRQSREGSRSPAWVDRTVGPRSPESRTWRVRPAAATARWPPRPPEPGLTRGVAAGRVHRPPSGRHRCVREAGGRRWGIVDRTCHRQAEHPLEQCVQFVELLAGQVVRTGVRGHGGSFRGRTGSPPAATGTARWYDNIRGRVNPNHRLPTVCGDQDRQLYVD
jgi:hypothetical protein